MLTRLSKSITLHRSKIFYRDIRLVTNLNASLTQFPGVFEDKQDDNRYVRKSNLFLVAFCGTVLYLNKERWQNLFGRFKVHALAQENVGETNATPAEQEILQNHEKECDIFDGEEKKKKKKRNLFRQKRIIEYENRLRMYSAPDKIFRYFATVKYIDNDGQASIFMTPEDFVRSLTPGVMQPRRYGLDMYKVYHPGETITASDESMIFNWLERGGLIAYEDYLFLMTLLSTSPNDFRLAFSVFDVNGDGLLDKFEFEKVQDLVLKQSHVGQKHRDNFAQGILFKKSGSTCLTRYFFGPNHDQKLTVDRFLQFQVRNIDLG
ncbi:unnamed protein product [Bursaphelenchus xylophilus]|uniref:(pine wood nematode) hypothetical protein n=1 Tax=Bursaphelenchus xylophilus TaxID=6326 RepID=A0A1I7SCJ7_BURXY|nr:unnamed protein product [Bursaphelenchus xylophilus]CAG9093981.1 unnamed protein product [Bursaphelenchus xylophilus]